MNFLIKKQIGISFILILVLASCVQLKKATLYDGVEVTPPLQKPENLKLIVEPSIYNEDPTDVWGLEKDICKEAQLSDIAYSGNQSIQMSWNRDIKGCKFAGIGIGWDGYAGKDLSSIMDFVAIQMHVRTQKGKSFGLPIVLTLEDYSGGMGFCYTSNRYFERSAIDEEWQKVIVPLNHFDLDTENLDPSNIKQLQLELQQSGSVLIDDISLILYEEPPMVPWMEEEKLPSPIATPIQIFDDVAINNNLWGLISDPCKTIELSETESAKGSKSLHLKWDINKEECTFNSFGVSWNKWQRVDLTPIAESAAFQFEIKMASGSATNIPLMIGFEDYERRKSFVELQPQFVSSGQYDTSWKKVTIPISAIQEGVDLKMIKQLYFTLKGAGDVFIDDLRMVEP